MGVAIAIDPFQVVFDILNPKPWRWFASDDFPDLKQVMICSGEPAGDSFFEGC